MEINKVKNEISELIEGCESLKELYAVLYMGQKIVYAFIDDEPEFLPTPTLTKKRKKHNTKVTKKQIRDMRDMFPHLKQKDIANSLDVSQGKVCKALKNGK